MIPGCTCTEEAETEEKLLDKVAADVKEAHQLEVTPCDMVAGESVDAMSTFS